MTDVSTETQEPTMVGLHKRLTELNREIEHGLIAEKRIQVYTERRDIHLQLATITCTVKAKVYRAGDTMRNPATMLRRLQAEENYRKEVHAEYAHRDQLRIDDLILSSRRTIKNRGTTFPL